MQTPRTRALFDACVDVFSLILSVQTADDLGEIRVLHKKTIALLEEMERQAAKANIAADDVQDAKFALVAFIDETVLNSSWAFKGGWRPLQLHYFNMTIAGNQFFEKLEEIRAVASKGHVLEIYHLCLMLGFKGRLELNPEEYKDYIDETCKRIKADEPKSIDRLSPSGDRRRFIDEGRRGASWWVWATLGTYVTILVIMGIMIF